MVIATLMESQLELSDDLVEVILDKTFEEADTDKDNRISRVEWKAYVLRHPSAIKKMTLPHLKYGSNCSSCISSTCLLSWLVSC